MTIEEVYETLNMAKAKKKGIDKETKDTIKKVLKGKNESGLVPYSVELILNYTEENDYFKKEDVAKVMLEHLVSTAKTFDDYKDVAAMILDDGYGNGLQDLKWAKEVIDDCISKFNLDEYQTGLVIKILLQSDDENSKDIEYANKLALEALKKFEPSLNLLLISRYDIDEEIKHSIEQKAIDSAETSEDFAQVASYLSGTEEHYRGYVGMQVQDTDYQEKKMPSLIYVRKSIEAAKWEDVDDTLRNTPNSLKWKAFEHLFIKFPDKKAELMKELKDTWGIDENKVDYLKDSYK